MKNYNIKELNNLSDGLKFEIIEELEHNQTILYSVKEKNELVAEVGIHTASRDGLNKATIVDEIYAKRVYDNIGTRVLRALCKYTIKKGGNKIIIRAPSEVVQEYNTGSKEKVTLNKTRRVFAFLGIGAKLKCVKKAYTKFYDYEIHYELKDNL